MEVCGNTASGAREQKHLAISNALRELFTATRSLTTLAHKVENNGGPEPSGGVDSTKEPMPSLLDVLDTAPNMIEENIKTIHDAVARLEASLF